MSRFNYVEVFPPTGYPGRLMGWPHSTPIEDAFLRASRPVTELYSQALEELDIKGYRAMLRLTCDVEDEQGSMEVRVRVLSDRPRDLPGEVGFIQLPPQIGRLDAKGRARVALESVHLAILLLAEARGWDRRLFQRCY